MQLGSYRIPDSPFRLPRLVEDVKRMYEQYSSNIVRYAHKNENLAKRWGYSRSRNGAFWAELAAAKSYGLLVGRGHVRVTDLAKRIISGEKIVQDQAYFDALQNILLWRELYRRYGLDLPVQGLDVAMVEITGCDPSTARNLEGSIRKAYSEDFSRVRGSKIIGPLIQSSPSEDTIELKIGREYHRFELTIEGKRKAIEVLRLLKVE